MKEGAKIRNRSNGFAREQSGATYELEKAIQYNYAEPDLRIATRVGGPSGSVTVSVYDGNGNRLDLIGPAQRGTPAQSLSAVIQG